MTCPEDAPVFNPPARGSAPCGGGSRGVAAWNPKAITPSAHLAGSMRRGRGLRTRAAVASLALLLLLPASARACAACFGQSDAPMARGMTWGIFSLLGVIVLVLGGVAGFFIHLARKSASVPTGAPAGGLLQPTPSAAE
jgi:hypothetical protein